MEYSLLKDVDYVMPGHANFSPRHKKLAEAEKLISDMRASSKHRLTVGIHEAGHFETAQKLGIAAAYAGPMIEHIRESDCWIVGFGRTQIAKEDWAKLTAEQAAEFCVSGRVAEIVLLNDAPIETSQVDFEDFIYSGKGRPSHLALIYKQAEERLTRELRSDLTAQQSIVRAGARFESQIFGVDRSIKAAA